MKIKHFSFFSDNTGKLDWENLRNSESDPLYYIPDSREKYIQRIDQDQPSADTRIIIDKIQSLGLNKVFSIGSGLASLEYQLKKFYNLYVVVSDYTPAILRLKSFDIFDECLQLDVLKDGIPVDKSFFVLFPRIDTEFDDTKLKKLFERIYNIGVEHICFIPAQLLSPHILLSELKVLILSIIKRKKLAFCGYTRSRKALNRIWFPYYKIDKGPDRTSNIFFLRSAK